MIEKDKQYLKEKINQHRELIEGWRYEESLEAVNKPGALYVLVNKREASPEQLEKLLSELDGIIVEGAKVEVVPIIENDKE